MGSTPDIVALSDRRQIAFVACPEVKHRKPYLYVIYRCFPGRYRRTYIYRGMNGGLHARSSQYLVLVFKPRYHTTASSQSPLRFE